MQRWGEPRQKYSDFDLPEIKYIAAEPNPRLDLRSLEIVMSAIKDFFQSLGTQLAAFRKCATFGNALRETTDLQR